LKKRINWAVHQTRTPAAESKAFTSDPAERVNWAVHQTRTPAAESKAFTSDPAERVNWVVEKSSGNWISTISNGSHVIVFP